MAVGGESIGRAYVKILADGGGFADDVEREVRKNAPELEKAGAEASRAYHAGSKKEDEKAGAERLKRLKAGLDRISVMAEKSGQRFGKAFGRGARNDFLNFFGGFMSILPRVGAALAGVAGWVAGLAETFADLRKNAGGGIEGVVSALGSLAGGGIPALIAAAGLVAVLLSSITFALAPFTSAIVLATGLVLSLAGSLGFALVGALVAVGGALVPFGAAIGVAALAMSGLDKKTKAFKNLKKEWKDLKKATATRVFGKDMGGLDGLTSVVKGLRPLINPVADALNNLLTSLGKTAETKEFKTLMGDLGKVLGPMAEDLGKVGGKLLTSFASAFIAAAPTVEKFIPLLEKFADWLLKISEGGKDSKLAKWFDDAWDSATKVAGLILSLIGLVGDLFGKGKGTGDNIFTKIKADVDKIRTWLADPKNSAAITQWFADAEKLYDKLVVIFDEIVEIVDKLDTPSSRTILFKLLDITADLLTGIGLVITKTDELNQAQQRTYNEGSASLKKRTEEITNGTAWDRLKTRIREAFDGTAADSFKTRINEAINGVAFTSLKTRASEAWAAVQAVFAPVGGFFTGVGNSISNSAAPGLDRLKLRATEAKNGVINAFTGLAGKVRKAGGNVTATVSEGWGRLKIRAAEARTGVVNAFNNLSGKIIAKAGNLSSRFSTWVSSLPGKARTTANSISSGFSNLSGKIITKAGSLSSRFSTWTAGVPGKAKTVANSIANAFSGLAKDAMNKAGSITSAIGTWASGVYSRARGVANDIVSAFSGLASRIVNAIGTIVPRISMPNIPRPHVSAIVDVVKPGASGGLFNSPEVRLIGEAGPEALVPLNRPLNRVDPAVRALSAFAQGLTPPGGTPAPGATGRHIEVGGITINTPTQDARAVASEVIARMATMSYI